MSPEQKGFRGYGRCVSGMGCFWGSQADGQGRSTAVSRALTLNSKLRPGSYMTLFDKVAIFLDENLCRPIKTTLRLLKYKGLILKSTGRQNAITGLRKHRPICLCNTSLKSPLVITILQFEWQNYKLFSIAQKNRSPFSDLGIMCHHSIGGAIQGHTIYPGKAF